MNDLGKPDAGEPHVRFDEEALETEAASWWDDLRTGSQGPAPLVHLPRSPPRQRLTLPRKRVGGRRSSVS